MGPRKERQILGPTAARAEAVGKDGFRLAHRGENVLLKMTERP